MTSSVLCCAGGIFLDLCLFLFHKHPAVELTSTRLVFQGKLVTQHPPPLSNYSHVKIVATKSFRCACIPVCSTDKIGNR